MVGEYKSRPTAQLGDVLFGDYFYPLIRGYLSGYKIRSQMRKDLEREDVVNQLVLQCLLGIPQFDGARGDAYSFFTKRIQTRYLDISRGQSRHSKRNILVSEFK